MKQSNDHVELKFRRCRKKGPSVSVHASPGDTLVSVHTRLCKRSYCRVYDWTRRLYLIGGETTVNQPVLAFRY